MIMNDIWPSVAKLPALKPGIVHVWRASLVPGVEKLAAFWYNLNTAERQRAERFLLQKHRDRFIASRSILREILSQYVNIPPEQIRFRYTAHGKPYFDFATDIFFNASDSNDLALYAITLNREVGIDIEFIRENFAGEEIAERFFSANEVAALQKLPSEQREEAFFNCWTRKEAFIKAIGEGLSYGLDQFDVSLAPNQPAQLLQVRGSVAEAQRWSLQSLEPAPGYAAALAVEGKIGKLESWQFPSTPVFDKS